MKEVFGIALTTIGFAIVYVAGTQYLTGYYDFFGISLLELGLPIHHVAQGAFVPIHASLTSFFPAAIAISVVLTLFAVFLCRESSIHSLNKKTIFSRDLRNASLRSVCVSWLILVISIWSYISISIAWNLGQANARNTINSLPLIYFAIDDDGQKKATNILADSAVNRLIVTNNNYYYILGDLGKGGERWVFRIPKEGVSAAFFQ